MTDDPDRDLPLHDEAKARASWRDGETVLAKGGGHGGLPASEVDDAAAPDEPSGQEGGTSAPTVAPPPD